MRKPLKFKNFENSLRVVNFLELKILNKSAVRFVLWWNLMNKTEQNSGFAQFSIWDPKARLRFDVLFKKFHSRINLTKKFCTKTYLLNTIFRPIKLFLDKISKTFTRGVPLGTWILKFWLFSFVSGPKITPQKCHQICSLIKFA
jgi:hypothetical protein